LLDVGDLRCSPTAAPPNVLAAAVQPTSRATEAAPAAPDRPRVPGVSRPATENNRGRLSPTPGRAASTGRDGGIYGAAMVATALADAAGVPVPPSAVVPVLLGRPAVALAVAAQCRERGVRVGYFGPPSVPAGTSRLRLTARADLTAADLPLVREVLATSSAPAGVR
jgi:hypothetical protein